MRVFQRFPLIPTIYFFSTTTHLMHHDSMPNHGAITMVILNPLLFFLQSTLNRFTWFKALWIRSFQFDNDLDKKIQTKNLNSMTGHYYKMTRIFFKFLWGKIFRIYKQLLFLKLRMLFCTTVQNNSYLNQHSMDKFVT